MKNRERFAKEILEIACSGDSIAIIEKSGRIVPCDATRCSLCLFRGYDCKENIREWAESEYVEKPVISKKDRAFLEYIDKKFAYIARLSSENLCLFVVEPRKKKAIWTSGYLNAILDSFNIDFPMVKFEDDKPWLIRDLKKLEVVEEYEK